MGLAVTLLSHHFSIKGVSALLLFYFSSFSFSTNQPINKYLVEILSEPFNLIKEMSLYQLLLFIRKTLPIHLKATQCKGLLWWYIYEMCQSSDFYAPLGDASPMRGTKRARDVEEDLSDPPCSLGFGVKRVQRISHHL